MTIFKRAITVMIRQPGKSMLLLLLMVILGAVLSGTIAISRAMVATEGRLMMQVPAVATLVHDWENATTPWAQPTVEEIAAVGSLPYVRVYDFTFEPQFYSPDLVWPFVDNPGSLPPRGRPFVGRGVNNPDITDIATGLIHLVEGRAFTQAEIDNDAMVVVIPRDFAVINDLSVGSMIELENVALNFFAEYGEDDALAYQMLEVEVIGIVSRDIDDTWGDSDLIYMPIGVAENMLNFITEVQLAFDADRFREVGQGILQEEPLIESLFVLYSPRDLEAFSTAAMELLSDGWVAVGIDESVFAPVVTSMDMVLQLANSVQWVAIVASIVILTLVILLFLRDRRHEIGVYMALGDKKGKVIAQILTEVGLVTVISIALAVLVGTLLSDIVSSHLFEQHLIEQMAGEHELFDVMPWELALYNPGEMTVEEAMALYDVSLDASTIAIFSSVSVAVIALSTVLPIIRIVKMNPKEILTE